MRKRNSLSKIIKNSSGASMLFILAVMLLLMAIGASTLTAASANAGVGINKQILNQLKLYSDSIQKSVMYSLQTCSDDNGKDILSNLSGDKPATLGGQLMSVLYQEAYSAHLADESDPDVKYYDYTGKKDINIEAELDEDEDLLAAVKSIIISTDSIVYVRKDYEEENPTYGDDGEEDGVETVYYPREVTIGAEVTVTVEVAYKEKFFVSVATYSYADGTLTNQRDETDDGPYESEELFIENAGEWGFVSHETIDN